MLLTLTKLLLSFLLLFAIPTTEVFALEKPINKQKTDKMSKKPACKPKVSVSKSKTSEKLSDLKPINLNEKKEIKIVPNRIPIKDKEIPIKSESKNKDNKSHCKK